MKEEVQGILHWNQIACVSVYITVGNTESNGTKNSAFKPKAVMHAKVFSILNLHSVQAGLKFKTLDPVNEVTLHKCAYYLSPISSFPHILLRDVIS